MRFLLLVFLSLSAADNRKSEPIDITKLTEDQQYAAELYRVTGQNDALRPHKKIYLRKIHEQKNITQDDLKKSSQIIAAANKKNIYDNPEFKPKE